MIVDGIKAAPAAVSWISTTKEARILSQFDHSCTLARDDGKLLSLVTTEIGPGPFALVVMSRHEPLDSNAPSFTGLRADAPVSIRNRALFLDWLEIDTTGIELWNPQPDWTAITPDIFIEHCSELKYLLLLHGPRGSLADLISGAELNQTQKLIRDVWPYLGKGLGELELSKYNHQIGQISGLGSGLTPTGDDFLLGIMMAIWSFVPYIEAKRLAGDIVKATNGRTTTLSTAWLAAAGKGEAAQYWHDFIEMVIEGDPKTLQQAGRRMIGVGHTSGADALTGFLLAGEILSVHPNNI